MTDHDLRVWLARIETKLDRVVQDKADHETRIRTLEQRSWSLAGIASIIGGSLTALVGWFLRGQT